MVLPTPKYRVHSSTDRPTCDSRVTVKLFDAARSDLVESAPPICQSKLDSSDRRGGVGSFHLRLSCAKQILETQRRFQHLLH